VLHPEGNNSFIMWAWLPAIKGNEAQAMKQLTAILFLVTAIMTISGCASGNPVVPVGPSTSLTLTSGNWLIVETTQLSPGVNNSPNYLRGSMTISDDTVTGNFFLDGNIIPLSGTISGNTVTLTGSSSNNVDMTISTTIQPGSILLGTFDEAQLGYSATGTVYGTYVPPLAGNWSGTVNTQYTTVIPNPNGDGGYISTSTDYQTGVTASIEQAAASSTIDNQPAFALSGTVILADSACFSSGSIALIIDPTQSYVAGEIASFVAASADGKTVYQYKGTLVDPTTPTAISPSPNGVSITTDSCDLGSIIGTTPSLMKP
jgi:hypothetical protein